MAEPATKRATHLELYEYLSVPDLAGWHVERVPDLPDESPITIAPDWACEIGHS